ncbi:hypothetical protein ACFXHB_44405, partial [Kitasatospora sp. NPDC059327]
MKLVGRTMTAAAAGVLLSVLTACGSSGSGTPAGGPGGSAAAAGQGSTATTGPGTSAGAADPAAQ